MITEIIIADLRVGVMLLFSSESIPTSLSPLFDDFSLRCYRFAARFSGSLPCPSSLVLLPFHNMFHAGPTPACCYAKVCAASKLQVRGQFENYSTHFRKYHFQISDILLVSVTSRDAREHNRVERANDDFRQRLHPPGHRRSALVIHFIF